jgi:hypothetical protein
MIAYLAFLALAASSPAEDQDAQMKCAAVLEAQAAKMRVQASILRADADYAETHNNQMSPEMMQRYENWYRKMVAGGANYPDLNLTNLSETQRQDRQRSVIDFIDHERNEREVFKSDIRMALMEACPWKAADIRSKSWPEGL